MNWFKKHLNFTAIIGYLIFAGIAGIISNFIVGWKIPVDLYTLLKFLEAAGLLFTICFFLPCVCYVFMLNIFNISIMKHAVVSNEIIVGLFIFGFLVLLITNVWVIKQKKRNLLWLLLALATFFSIFLMSKNRSDLYSEPKQ
jgi:hypothetical protein